MATSESRPLVMICAATYWHGTTMLDHHLARELARYADVIYLDPPTSFLTKWRNPAAGEASRRPRYEQVQDGITVVRPRVNPLMERRGGKLLALALTRLAMLRAARRFRPRPVHAVVLLSLNPLLGVLRERFRVFYASDDLAAGAELMGITDPHLAARAIRLPRQADVVAAVSATLVESLRAEGVPALLIPNGVQVEHFATAATVAPATDIAGLGPRLVGFVGHLGDRIDVDLIAAVADRQCTVVLVGPWPRSSRSGPLATLMERPNVHWVGPRSYAELPAVLAAAEVWMLPYADSEFNRASFPLKLLEYLAAGRRVVATDLPAVQWLDSELIVTAAGAKGFAAAVESELSRPWAVGEAAARTAFAAGHGWPERVRVLAERLFLTGPPDPPTRAAKPLTTTPNPNAIPAQSPSPALSPAAGPNPASSGASPASSSASQGQTQAPSQTQSQGPIPSPTPEPDPSPSRSN